MKDSKVLFFKSMLGGALGASIVFLLIFVLFNSFIDIKFLDDASCIKEKGYSFCFFDKDWDSEKYLSIITSFYNNLITILIFIVTLIAGLCYLVIRGNAIYVAKKEIEKEVIKYFETQVVQEKIETQLFKVKDMRLDNINSRFEIIEKALEDNDISVVSRLEVGNEEKT